MRRVVVVAAVLAATACTGAEPSSTDSLPADDGASRSQVVASITFPPLSGGALPGEVERRLQKVLDEWVEINGDIGLTAAAATPEGSWAGAAGVDGVGTALEPTSAQAIGSITKTFVAAELMLLADEGRVDLDADLEAYLDLPFDGAGATVRQLLGMESGYPVDVIDEVVDRVREGGTGRHWTATEILDLVDPGSGRQGSRGGPDSYNNTNYWVLGLLIEEVTGRSLAHTLRRDLVEPAGLDRLWFQDAERPQPPLTRAHPAGGYAGVDVVTRGPFLPSRAVGSSAGAAGGMAADAPSLARWVYQLYGGHLINPLLVAQMTSAEHDVDWYGLGTMIGDLGNGPHLGHSGDVFVYHSAAFVWPADQVAIAVLIPQPEGLSRQSAFDVATALAAVAPSQ